MKAKEKSKQLISKYSPKLPFYTEKDNLNKSKECALICVDEIINTISLDFIRCNNRMQTVTYWQEVKEEIIKL